MGRRQTVGKFHDFIWPTALCRDDFIGVTIDLIIASSEILPYDPGIIGVLVPGIIANELERQGAVKSLMSLAVVVGILALIMMGMGMQVFRV